MVLTRLRSTALANIKVKVIHSYHCLHRFKLGKSIVNEFIKLPCFIPFFNFNSTAEFLPYLNCTYELLYQFYRNKHWISGIVLISL